MVAVEARLIRAADGNIYGKGPINYDFFRRYLNVFEEVIVLARVKQTRVKNVEKLNPAEGHNVKVHGLPSYVGPWQFLRQYKKLNNLAKRAVREADVFILRVPGTIGTLLWRHLMKNKIPYGVEIVADPWDSLAPGSVKTILRSVLRQKMKRDLKKQCKNASVSAYVTEYSLQKRYPPGGWSTHYSSIDLSAEMILDESVIDDRMERLKTKIKSDKPICCCCIGTMNQLYKAPDILIEALGICIKRGMKIELVMIGDGQFRYQLQEQSQNLGIADNVKFLGWLSPGKDVFEQLDESDLYVLPSRQEGLPRTIIEAMARGLPWIGSTGGGFGELLAPDELVPPGNSKLLARKIEEIIGDRPRLEKMARRNLKNALKYTSDKLTERRNIFFNRLKEASQKER